MPGPVCRVCEVVAKAEPCDTAMTGKVNIHTTAKGTTHRHVLTLKLEIEGTVIY